MRQAQNAASARATQEDLILNIKNSSPLLCYLFLYYVHTLVWVINTHWILYKENFWRLSVHGAQHTKGNDLRDGGKPENENKPKLSIWLFLCKGKLTHSAWFRTSDMGLRQRGKVNVKSGSPHAELQLPVSYYAQPALQRQHQEKGRYQRPCTSGHSARISSSCGSGLGWKHDPKQQEQQICSLPTVFYNPQQWGDEQAA